MRNYEIETVKNNTTRNGKIVQKTIRIKAKNNKPINYNNIRTFFNSLQDKGYNINKISIGGMGVDKYLTMKRFDEDDLKPWDDDDYYKDKVQDNKKFDKFFFVDFNIRA